MPQGRHDALMSDLPFSAADAHECDVPHWFDAGLPDVDTPHWPAAPPATVVTLPVVRELPAAA